MKAIRRPEGFTARWETNRQIRSVCGHTIIRCPRSRMRVSFSRFSIIPPPLLRLHHSHEHAYVAKITRWRPEMFIELKKLSSYANTKPVKSDVRIIIRVAAIECNHVELYSTVFRLYTLHVTFSLLAELHYSRIWKLTSLIYCIQTTRLRILVQVI